MEEYEIMNILELTETRCRWWMGNSKFIWSGLSAGWYYHQTGLKVFTFKYGDISMNAIRCVTL